MEIYIHGFYALRAYYVVKHEINGFDEWSTPGERAVALIHHES